MPKEEQYNDEQFRLAIEHMKANDVFSAVTRSDVARILNCHPNTATKRLNRLAENGIIIKRTIHDNCFYWIEKEDENKEDDVDE